MTKQLRKTYSGDAEEFVWNMRWRGHDIIQKRVAKYGIDCDLKHGHLQAAYKPSHMAELDHQITRGQAQWKKWQPSQTAH